MGKYLIAGLATIAIGAAAGWWHEKAEKLRAEGRAEIHKAAADSVQRVADARADTVEVQRAEIARRDTALIEARARVETVTARERARRPEIVERIVHAPDTAAIREAVEELEASHAAEVTGLTDALAVSDSLIASYRTQVGTLESEVADLRRVNASLRVAIGASGGPGFVERWGGRIVAVGVGVGVGYVLARR